MKLLVILLGAFVLGTNGQSLSVSVGVVLGNLSTTSSSVISVDQNNIISDWNQALYNLILLKGNQIALNISLLDDYSNQLLGAITTRTNAASTQIGTAIDAVIAGIKADGNLTNINTILTNALNGVPDTNLRAALSAGLNTVIQSVTQTQGNGKNAASLAIGILNVWKSSLQSNLKKLSDTLVTNIGASLTQIKQWLGSGGILKVSGLITKLYDLKTQLNTQVSTFVDTLTQNLTNLSQMLGSALTIVGSPLKLFQALINLSTSVVEAFTSQFLNNIDNIISDLNNATSQIDLNKIGQIVSNIQSNCSQAINDISNGVITAFNTVYNNLGNSLNNVIGVISQIKSQLPNDLGSSLETILNDLASAVAVTQGTAAKGAAAIQQLLTVLSAYMDKIASSILTTVTGFTNNLSGVLTSLISKNSTDPANVINQLQSLKNNITVGIDGLLQEVIAENEGALQLALNAIASDLNPSKIIDAILTIINSILNGVSNKTETIIDNLMNQTSNANIQSIINIADNIKNGINNATSTVYQDIQTALNNLCSNIGSNLQNINGTISSTVTNLPDDVEQGVKSALQDLVTAIIAAKGDGLLALNEFINAVDQIRAAVQAAAESFSGSVNVIVTDKVQELLSSLQNGTLSAQEVADALNATKTEILTALTKLPSTIEDSITGLSNVVDGITALLTQGAQEVVSALSQLSSAIYNKAQTIANNVIDFKIQAVQNGEVVTNNITTLIADIGTQMVEKVRDFRDELCHAVIGLRESLDGNLNNITDKIQEAVGTLDPTIGDPFGAVLTALADGITGSDGIIADWQAAMRQATTLLLNFMEQTIGVLEIKFQLITTTAANSLILLLTLEEVKIDAILTILNKASSTVATVVSGLITAAGTVINAVTGSISGIIGGIIGWIL